MKRAIWRAVAALLLAGCGSDGDGGVDTGERAETGVGTPLPAEEIALFRSDEIDFTFEYPKELAAETKPEGQVLAQVSIDRGARLNAIKVRRTADRALAPDRYLDEFQKDFSKAVGAVEKREERIGGREMGVLEFDDSLEQSGGAIEFTSSSYFFTGAGGTWQMECIADREHREEIEAACRTALESIEFPSGGQERGPRRSKQLD